MSRPKGSPNKIWPENWLPLLRAIAPPGGKGTLGALAKACNVSAPTVARWRDGHAIHESHAVVLKALAEKHAVPNPTSFRLYDAHSVKISVDGKSLEEVK